MKKLIFSALALGLVFLSCEKEDVTAEATSNAVAENTDPSNTRGYLWPVYYEIPGPPNGTGDLEYGCRDHGGYCYGLRPVYGVVHQYAISTIIDVVNGENPVDIADVFMLHYDVAVEYIDSDMVDGAIEGVYTVKNTGDFSLGSIAYLQFYDAEDAVAGVFRLTY